MPLILSLFSLYNCWGKSITKSTKSSLSTSASNKGSGMPFILVHSFNLKLFVLKNLKIFL